MGSSQMSAYLTWKTDQEVLKKKKITFLLHPKKCLPTLSVCPLAFFFFFNYYYNYLPTSLLNGECDLLVIRTLSTKDTYFPNWLEFFQWYTC